MLPLPSDMPSCSNDLLIGIDWLFLAAGEFPQGRHYHVVPCDRTGSSPELPSQAATKTYNAYTDGLLVNADTLFRKQAKSWEVPENPVSTGQSSDEKPRSSDG